MTELPPSAPATVGPSLDELLDLFPGPDRPDWELLPAHRLPEPYRRLLAHTHHMTVTVEAFHGGPVDVRVLERRRDGHAYSRKILLALRETGKVVQFGIVRIRLDLCDPAVRDEILAERTPLGRVLIEHGVLRRVEPTGFGRVPPGPATAAWFGQPDAATYGRLGIIHCDGRPAIEVLEVVAPVE